MTRWKRGDRVTIVQRLAAAADIRAGLYFPHYAGLSGTIFHTFGNGDSMQAAVRVDLESLPEEIARRHVEVQNEMQVKASGGTRLPAGVPPLQLHYVVLVAHSDLRKAAARAEPTAPAEKSVIARKRCAA